MKLSVIIPVYKVEAYLDFCLKSIVRQDIADCEIILVNDCSPDRCGEICDRWAQKDSRIRVCHCPENGGLSKARNIGLDMASGEYITFIDSDDYISPQTLNNNMKVLEAHPDIDILEYPICMFHGTKKAYRYTPGINKKVGYGDWVSRKGYLHCYAWNKIYKRSLWEKQRFPENKLFEDIYTIPSVMQQARCIFQSDKGLYYYCSREGSISNTLCDKGINDLLEANLQLYNTISSQLTLKEKDLDDLYLRLCNTQIIRIQFGGRLCIPERKIPLRRALFTRRPLNYRIKAVLKALSGTHYCKLVAQTRKVLKK